MLSDHSDINSLPQCQYFDINSFPRICSESALPFSIFCINIRSFNRNIDELLVFLRLINMDPTVIVITETWFSEDCTVELDGYCGYHVHRTGRRGGGVSVFVRNQFKSRAVEHWSSIRDEVELSTVELYLNGEVVRIVGIYRPPDCDSLAFCDTIEAILSDIGSSKTAFIVGDFNMDLIDRTPVCSRFVDIMHASSFFPLVDVPTYYSYSHSPSCLDQMWYNQMNDTLSGVFEIHIADHYPVLSLFAVPVKSRECFVKSFRDHSRHSLEKLRDKINALVQNFDVSVARGVDVCVSEFCDRIYCLYDACCPIRKKCYPNNRSSKPWINDALMDCINRKHSLFRQYKSGDVDFNVYNTFKNNVTLVIKRSKERYYNDKFVDCNGDAKATWKTINSITSRIVRKKLDPEIVIDGRRVTQGCDVAEHFNSFFCNVAVNINRTIPVTAICPLQYLGERVPNSMFALPASTSDVISIVDSLQNKSCHLSDVPVFIYKKCSDLISPIICRLFNLSLETGVFPMILKAATIIPIHKSGDATLVNNYRPISMIPILAKIFEKLMLRKLMSFIKCNKLIADNQFGFKKNCSTEDALLEFLNGASESLSSKCTLISVFLDFAKAFDTVDFDILLRKLDHLGVRGVMNNWFRSYLHGRTQQVLIRESLSSRRDVMRGVPQGSVLGPILFLLYINDMHRCCERLKLVHFADDTTAVCIRRDARVLIDDVNLDLALIKDWVDTNRLSLNVEKTNYIIVSDSVLPDLNPVIISGTVVQRVSNCKFLGVYFDQNLDFKLHVNEVCKKLSRAVGMMNRVSGLIPPYVKLKIYHSLIYSRVCYGISVWGRSSVSNVSRIDCLLRKARRCVRYGFRGDTVVSNTFFNCSFIYDYFVLIKVYKILNLGHHQYFTTIFSELAPSHGYGTRFSVNNLINTPRLSKTKCQKLFLFQSIFLWNSLPDVLKTCQSLPKFKKILKQHILCI